MRASLPLGHHVVAFATLPAGFMLPSAPTNDAPPPALVRENADEPKDEDFICFYRTQSSPVTTRPRRTMRHFNLSRDYIVRMLNETIAGCEGQDIRKWKCGER
jgi:hypothetical protein